MPTHCDCESLQKRIEELESKLRDTETQMATLVWEKTVDLVLGVIDKHANSIILFKKLGINKESVK